MFVSENSGAFIQPYLDIYKLLRIKWDSVNNCVTMRPDLTWQNKKLLRNLTRSSDDSQSFFQTFLVAKKETLDNQKTSNWFCQLQRHLRDPAATGFFSKTDINLSELREYWIYQNKDNNDKDLIRLLFLITTVEELKKSSIPGSLAEVGVYRGNSAKVLNSLCPERDLYLFDTFSGFDEKDCESENADPGGFSNTSIGQVQEFIGTQDNIHYLQGYFPETTRQLDPDARFALVHIDVDLYQPTKACLEYFYDKLEPGGFLILHDYGNPRWPGVLRAAQEFFSGKPEKLVWIPDKSGSGLIRRV